MNYVTLECMPLYFQVTQTASVYVFNSSNYNSLYFLVIKTSLLCLYSIQVINSVQWCKRENHIDQSFHIIHSFLSLRSITLKVLNFWKCSKKWNGWISWQLLQLKTLLVGHGGSSAGSYLADPTSPIPSHCAVINPFKVSQCITTAVTSTLS